MLYILVNQFVLSNTLSVNLISILRDFVQNNLISILYSLFYFIIAITSLVLIHEGGHFLVAKAVGMKVNEFAIGMGPKLWSRQKGETLYSLRAIPIGGFIRPEGEDEESEHPRAFGNKPLWARAAVVAAGPISNFILAFLIVILLITFTGVDLIKINNIASSNTNDGVQLTSGDVITKINDKKIYIFEELSDTIKNAAGNNISMTVRRNNNYYVVNVPIVYSNVLNQKVMKLNTISVGSIDPDMPAAKSGLAVGDIIIKVNGHDVYTFEELVQLVDRAKGQSIALEVDRNGVRSIIDVPTKFEEKYNRYLIGILSKPIFGLERVSTSLYANFTNSISYSGSLVKQIGYGLRRLFSGNMTKDEMAGPVRIYAITGEVAMQGLRSFVNFIALLSLSLGIFNLFPIPALDGGRLLFMGIEGLRGKAIDQKKEAVAHLTGFALLIGLMILITFNDIKLLFGQ